MTNVKAPKRLTAFKDQSQLNPARLDTEFDNIYVFLREMEAFLRKAHEGDGSIRLRQLLPEHFKARAFRDITQDLTEKADAKRLQINAEATAVQNLIAEVVTARDNTVLAAADAKVSLSHVMQAAGNAADAASAASNDRNLATQAAVVAGATQSSAETASASARIAEDMAYRWAEKMDGPVFVPVGGDQTDDGFFSSKYWANQAFFTIKNGSYWYLGPHPSDPTEGHRGEPLQPGMWYYNTTDATSYMWNGTTWDELAASEVISVFGRTGTVVAQQTDYATFYADKAVTEAHIVKADAHFADKDNPHETNWDNLGDVPQEFPPAEHQHSWDEIEDKPQEFPPTAHSHTEAHISNLDRQRWKGEWTAGNFVKNDEVTRDGYLAVAIADTSEDPLPLPIGNAAWVYTGTSPEAQITAKSLAIRNKYIPPTTMRFPAYRVFTVTGNDYSVYRVNEATGQIVPLITFTASTTGWREFSTAGSILAAGQEVSIIVVVSEPDPSPVTFVGDWSYTSPNNWAPPLDGQIVQADKNIGILSVSKEDDNGTDRSAELAGISPGDTVEADGLRWSIQSVTDMGTFIDFAVAPAQQVSDGVHEFIFETVSSTPITTIVDPDFYLGESAVVPSYQIDGGAEVFTDDGLGLDVQWQEVQLPTDWAIKSYPGTGSGGGTSPDVEPVTIVTDDYAAGYQVVGDVLFQWGSGVGGSTPNVVVFPVAFNSLPKVTITIQAANPNDRFASLSNVQTTGFDAYLEAASGAAVGNTFYWMAAGEAPPGLKMPKTIDGIAGGGNLEFQEYIDPANVSSWRIIGGVLECWGVKAGVDTEVAVAYGKEFALAPSITATCGDSAANATVAMTKERTTVGATISIKRGNNGNPAVGTVTWHAIGEWNGV